MFAGDRVRNIGSQVHVVLYRLQLDLIVSKDMTGLLQVEADFYYRRVF